MHRPRLARIVLAALTAALLLPSAALAAPTAAAAASVPVTIPLSCKLVVPNPLSSIAPNRAVVCKWTAPAGVDVAAYRLRRSVDGGPRKTIATIPGDGTLRYADRNIRTGHAYRYVVVGIGADRTRVARSNVATVKVGRQPQALRFNCVAVIDATSTAARCHWSATTRPAAVRYVLWRSVDGGAREAIYRTRITGRRTFVDTDVKPGQVVRYAVVAVTKTGRIVAIGGPDVVKLPN
jgi:fibronectin type 3 domain-containing protein